MLALVLALVKNDTGATAVEYGLIAALVSVAMIAALGNLGGSLSVTFSTVSERLTDAATP